MSSNNQNPRSRSRSREKINDPTNVIFIDEDEYEDMSLFVKDWITKGLDMGYIDLTQKEEVMDWIRVLTNKKIEVI